MFVASDFAMRSVKKNKIKIEFLSSRKKFKFFGGNAKKTKKIFLMEIMMKHKIL